MRKRYLIKKANINQGVLNHVISQKTRKQQTRAVNCVVSYRRQNYKSSLRFSLDSQSKIFNILCFIAYFLHFYLQDLLYLWDYICSKVSIYYILYYQDIESKLGKHYHFLFPALVGLQQIMMENFLIRIDIPKTKSFEFHFERIYGFPSFTSRVRP